MKKRILSFVLCICLMVSLLTVMTSAAAKSISVESATYYDNNDVKSVTVSFGWDTASATSRLAVMTNRLRSAGESGTNKSYGDFTDLGYYGTKFSSWEKVLAQNTLFGIISYSDEQNMKYGKTNTLTLELDKGDIPLNNDGTYYIYLWTYYGGKYYPDNLFMVFQVKNGVLRYAPATGRNSYGDFSILKNAASEATTPSVPKVDFSDVKDGDYFATPVNWAVDKGITVGTSNTTFSPNSTCTRAQILTFMWRAAGSPEPSSKIVNFYVDIKESDYFYKAALWAREKGIHVPSDEYFRPNTPCTRASTVEYFWRLAGAKIGDVVPFSDIDHGSTLENAVSWAVTNGITAGTGGTAFTPDTVCTRAQIVTFLYRYYVVPIDNTSLIETLKKTVPQRELKLDPLPPENYLKQPDWYGTLTPPAEMTDERLMAELKQIRGVMDDFRARDIYMSDAIYSRELDLWSQASRRGLE